MRTYAILFALVAICCIAACKKSQDQPSDLTTDYMPVKQGSQWLYHVDSLVYDDNSGSTTIDTVTYQYKEVVGDVIRPGEEFVLNRYHRASDTAAWIEGHSWSLVKNDNRYEKVQENTRLVKLVFPLTAGKSWNGNMYNNRGEELYTVNSFDAGFGNYERTATISQFEEINLIEEIVRYEVYARGTGLVYALSDSLNTQSSGTRGFRYRLTLVSFTP